MTDTPDRTDKTDSTDKPARWMTWQEVLARPVEPNGQPEGMPVDWQWGPRGTEE